MNQNGEFQANGLGKRGFIFLLISSQNSLNIYVLFARIVSSFPIQLGSSFQNMIVLNLRSVFALGIYHLM